MGQTLWSDTLRKGIQKSWQRDLIDMMNTSRNNTKVNKEGIVIGNPLGWINRFIKKNKMNTLEEVFNFPGTDKRTGKKEERMIVGKIVSHPITTFSNINWNKQEFTQGFVYKVRTQQLQGYDLVPVDINICSVFDVSKWDLLKKGQEVQLSVLKKEKSKFSDDGFALKCNVVNRKKY